MSSNARGAASLQRRNSMRTNHAVAALALGGVLVADVAFAQTSGNAPSRGTAAGGPRAATAPNCPLGCRPVAPPLTPEQQRRRAEAARLARERREQIERDRQAAIDEAARRAEAERQLREQAQREQAQT